MWKVGKPLRGRALLEKSVLSRAGDGLRVYSPDLFPVLCFLTAYALPLVPAFPCTPLTDHSPSNCAPLNCFLPNILLQPWWKNRCISSSCFVPPGARRYVQRGLGQNGAFNTWYVKENKLWFYFSYPYLNHFYKRRP